MTTKVKITHDQEHYPMDLLVKSVQVNEQTGEKKIVREEVLKAGESLTEMYAHSGMYFEVHEIPAK